jgi:hypothetical protein
MLDSLRATLAIPRLPARAALSVGTFGTFGWLLSHDLIHPLVVYLLELYLTF